MKKSFYTLAAISSAVMALSACGTSSNNHKHSGMVDAPAPTAPAVHTHHNRAPAQVSVSPQQAIGIAQKQAGGQATEISLKGKYGNPVYKVEVRNGQREHTVYIDASNGSVRGGKLETEWKPMRQTAVSLERAMEIAQGKINGRVLDAERDSKRGQIVYKVEVLSADNVPHKVIIDADNGSVLASYVDYDD